jgi:hypothetical protein
MTGNTNNLTVFERKKSKEPKQENPPRSPMSGHKVMRKCNQHT